MDEFELGVLLVSASVFVALGLANPVWLLLTAFLGGCLVVVGVLRSAANDHESTDCSRSRPDLIECPNCRGLEDAERTTCRFCQATLPDATAE